MNPNLLGTYYPHHAGYIQDRSIHPYHAEWIHKSLHKYLNPQMKVVEEGDSGKVMVHLPPRLKTRGRGGREDQEKGKWILFLVPLGAARCC